MTLVELKYLLALAKEGHFGKAAERCHVSQPTLSMAINKLEKSLGVTVFERQKNGIRITDIGEKLIVQAQRVLEEADCFHAIANRSKDQLDTPLRIGGIFTVAPYVFPPLIPKLKKITPRMPLVIDEDYTSNLRVKLQRGDCDVIFIALPFKEPSVVVKPLYEEPFMVLLPKQHPLAQQQYVSRKALAGEHTLLLGEGHCLREHILETCPQCYPADQPHETIQGTSLETLRHMVASGLGITILPGTATQVRHYAKTLCVKPFKEKTPKRTVALAWRSSFPRRKAIDALIQALNEANLSGICPLV